MKVRAEFKGKKKFSITAGDHSVLTDLPAEKSGEDSSLSPVEIFIGALGSCMGVYGTAYLKNAGFDPEGFSVELSWSYGKSGGGIEKIQAEIVPPNEDIGKREKALLAACKSCVIHKTFRKPPDISISLRKK